MVDVDRAAAESMAGAHGAKAMDADAVFGDPEVAAIVISSSTPTHSDYIEAGAAAGKHVFCEKPIDLDSARSWRASPGDEALGRFVYHGMVG